MAHALPLARPALGLRCFTSSLVEQTIEAVGARIADPNLRTLFSNCLPNTLDTTVTAGQDAQGRPDTFIITGDIDAMWLRDSTNQVWPYLPFAGKDAALRRMLAGVVARQAACVRLDPYANAFNRTPTGGEWQSDHTTMIPELHERKYELDSLVAVLRLACGYFSATDDISPFDADWLQAFDLIVLTIRAQQAGTAEDEPPVYSFQRTTPTASDTLPMGGRGHPARRCGLSKSHFRPSDDAHHLPFPVAANAMAVVWLRKTAALLNHLQQAQRALGAQALADEIDLALQKHGTTEHAQYGRIWAFEVDGFGNAYCIDDANVPSLLALPYLGYGHQDDALYQRTRAFVLSPDNPYFFRGKAGEGIGGPHVGMGMIWPMAITMRALTSSDDAEIRTCLRTLRDTTAGTGFIHETFHQDDAARFSRAWFAWANTLFGELILHLDRTRPGLLAQAMD
jgi:meiotically up-regulated gene 157 (Mug157) protein